jgi:hypothetical protein
MNCFALGIVADSPQAWELASMPRTMSGKPDGERSEPERPKKYHLLPNLNFDSSITAEYLSMAN